MGRERRNVRFALLRAIVIQAVIVTAAQGRSWADDGHCTEIDLRKDGGVMSHMPVMDQDGMNGCFAYAAAQLVDALRFKNTPALAKSASPPRTSPLAVMVEVADQQLFYRMNNPLTAGGGFQCDLANFVAEHGACDERVVTQSATRDPYQFPYGAFWKLNRTYDFHSKLEQLQRAAEIEHGKGGGEIRKRARDALERFLRQNRPSASCYPGSEIVSSKELEKDLNSILGKSSFAYALSSSIPECREAKNRIPPVPLKCSAKKVFTQSGALAGLNDALDHSGGLPVGITYCSMMLIRGREQNTRWWAEVQDALFGTQNCGHHSSIVIGRRSQKTPDGANKCQFLIRNTWGDGCNQYSSDWSCENGDIWVDEDTLGNNLTGLITVGKK